MSSKFAKVYLSRIDGKASALAQVVFMYLSKYADKRGICYPSVKTLMKHTKLSNKTIIKLIRELEEIGAIRIKKTNGARNIYKICDEEYENNE